MFYDGTIKRLKEENVAKVRTNKCVFSGYFDTADSTKSNNDITTLTLKELGGVFGYYFFMMLMMGVAAIFVKCQKKAVNMIFKDEFEKMNYKLKKLQVISLGLHIRFLLISACETVTYRK
jgi:hypothetical protein